MEQLSKTELARKYLKLRPIKEDEENVNATVRDELLLIYPHISFTKHDVRNARKRAELAEPEKLSEDTIIKIREKLEQAESSDVEEPIEWEKVKNDSTDITRDNDSSIIRRAPHRVFPGEKEGRWIVIGCIHAPFQLKRFIDAVLNMISNYSNEIVGIVFNGDIIDMNSISRHNKNNVSCRTGLTLDEEYDWTNKLLDDFESALKPNTTKAYQYGNHEDWYFQHMRNVDNAKLGKGTVLGPTQALRLHERHFFVNEDWKNDFFTLGNSLQVMHGIYCNVHAAKKHIDVFGSDVIFNHTHRLQTFSDGKRMGYNIGFGGDVSEPNFNYAPRGVKETWTNGFAEVFIDDIGEHHVTPIRFKDGKFVYNGKKY